MRRITLFAAVVLVSVPALMVFAGEDRIETLKIGASAPDFNLPAMDGKTYTLSDFADANVLVVVFTCNHCPTAQAYEERIKRLTSDYQNKGVAVVGITPNDPQAVRLDELGYSDLSDSYEETRYRAITHKFNFVYLYDGRTQETSKAYGPVSTPHAFVLDCERKLRYEGAIDDSENWQKVKTHFLRGAIDAVLAGRTPEIAQSKSFGCSIKWASKREWVQKGLEDWAKEPVTLKDIDAAGVAKLLQNSSRNLRLINLWASWCGPCVIEFPELVTINRMYRGRQFEMVTVSIDEPDRRESVLKFLQSRQASTTNYILNPHDQQAFMKSFDKEFKGAIPYTLVLNPGGKVIYRAEGMIDVLAARQAIIGYLGRYYFKVEPGEEGEQ